MVQDYDAEQLLQWGRDGLCSSEAFYNSSQVPASHFVKVQVHRIPTSTVPSAASDPSNKPKKSTGNKRSAPTSSPDFVSAQPVFELVNAPTDDRGCFSQFMEANPTGSRMPQLPNQEGKFSLICFSSAASAPFNKCNLAQCFRNQISRTRNPRYNNPEGPPPFCHVDFSLPRWADKPESFCWGPVVQWLRLPSVARRIRPSEFLKAKTPATPW
jgi:hypothetical protein